MICIGLSYIIRTCMSTPLWAVADSFDHIRSGPVPVSIRINTGIPAEWIRNLRWSQLVSKHRFESKCSTKVSPLERESKTVLDFEFYATDSRFQVINFILSVELGFWIPIFSGIPDSLSCIPDSKAQDFGFHEQKFPCLRNSDSLTWGEKFTSKKTTQDNRGIPAEPC